MSKLFILLFFAIVLVSCEKKEKPIAPYDRGNVASTEVSLGSNYQYQIYYSLNKQQTVKSVDRLDWDLAFDCSNNHIILTNNGRGIYIAKTDKTNLSDIMDTVGYKFYWGQPSLNSDSLAFGQWWKSLPKVFIINMGYNQFGKAIGFIKCIPELLADNSLKLTYCSIESNAPQTINIKKDSRFNFNFVSLLNNKIVEIEPPKETWDLLFTQYVKLLFSPPYPATRNYEVVGVIVNNSRIETGFNFKQSFKDINSSQIPDSFYTTRDAIGFSWKWFDIGANSYTVYPAMNFILKASDGFYYKLHFLDFYDDKGVKGNPKFEFQKL